MQWLPAVAKDLNAFYVLVSGVDANEQQIFAGFQTYTNSSAYATASANNVSAHGSRALFPFDEASSHVRSGRFRGLDGQTGEVATERVKGPSAASCAIPGTRKSLIEDLTPKAVGMWLDNPL